MLIAQRQVAATGKETGPVVAERVDSIADMPDILQHELCPAGSPEIFFVLVCDLVIVQDLDPSLQKGLVFDFVQCIENLGHVVTLHPLLMNDLVCLSLIHI